MKKIMIVEDEIFMRNELASILVKSSYLVCCVSDFLHTVNHIMASSPDLVLLDINLPYASGFEICKSLRQKSSIPILILTSRDQLNDELHALGLGADEYLTKPCHKERLLARVANLLRRYEDREHFIEAYGIKLDLQTYTMYVNGTSVVLPENQGKIMDALLLHANETVTKAMLFQKLWGTEQYIDENALQVNMTRLKKTLASLGMHIKILTIRGTGYQLAAISENVTEGET